MVSNVVRNFVRQQGCSIGEDPAARFRSLNFQPLVVAPLAAIAMITQSKALLLGLGAVLWWSALVPRFNPFDLIYNAVLAREPQRPRLTPSPPPRRFAMGMAGTFFLAAGLFLTAGWTLASAVVQGFIVVALVALLAGRLCLGSYIFHLIRGNAAFANETLPWKRPAQDPRQPVA